MSTKGRLATGMQLIPACSRGDDTNLMIQARDGDAAALDQLIARNYPNVVRFAERRLRDRHRAEDVAQETFLRLVRSRERYQPSGRFLSFLFRIASKRDVAN